MSTRFLKTLARAVAPAVALFLPAAAAQAADAAAPKPNVLIIVADDQGYGDLGVHGCKDIPTPHIDSIAKEGVRFTSGYVTGPYCSPTRAGLLTGRYQQRFGHEFNPGPQPGVSKEQLGLPTTETTLADRLKAAGYSTALVGKWHLGSAPHFHPQKRGFDEFFGFLGGAHSYLKWDTKAQPILRGTEPAPAEETYLTDAFGREAAAYLDRRRGRDEPFFLYLAFNAVHGPLHATQKYLDRFPNLTGDRKTYAAMTSALDDAVGVVLDRLRANGQDENTIVFYVSDNGGPPVNASDNRPLRGYKAQTLEGGVRVPFFVRWTGRVPAGKTYDQPVIQLDIHATALALAGATAPADKPLEGVDLLPYIGAETANTAPPAAERPAVPHEHVYWRFGNQWAIRSGDWKLVAARGLTAPALFDLSKDPGEATDLAAQHPEKVTALKAAYDAWDAKNVEPLWKQNPKRKKNNAAAAADAKPGRKARRAAKRNADADATPPAPAPAPAPGGS